MIIASHVIFYVKDVKRTVRFYEDAFGVKVKFYHESGHYAELATGTLSLAFVSEEMAHSNLPQGFQRHDLHGSPAACEIAFTTDNVQKACDRAIKAGAKLLVPAQEKPWGQTIAYFRDPDGILVEIGSVMEGE